MRIRKGVAKQKAETKAKVIAWRESPKVGFESDAEIQLFLDNTIQHSDGLRVNDEELAKLNHALHVFLLAYSKPSFSNYIQVKGVIPYTVRIPADLSAACEKRMKAHGGTNSSFPDLSEIWEYVHSKTVSNQYDSFTKICLTNNSITFKALKTNDFEVYEECRKLLEHMIGEMSNDIIVYKCNTEQILLREPYIIAAIAKFVVLYNFSPNPSPVVVVYFWCPEHRTWIPWKLAVHSMHFRTLF